MAYRRTLSDLRTAVRDNLDEASASFWTNAQLLRFLNRAKDRVQTEVRRVKDDYFVIARTSTDGALTIMGESYTASNFAIVAGTTTYSLPPDFIEIRLIECVTSGYEGVRFIYRDLSHPDMRAAMEVTTNVSPGIIWFDIYGERTLRIAPKSDTALDLRLTYVRATADLSADGDTLEMPEPLYMAVEEYATATAMAMDRNPDAAVHEARAKQLIAEFVGANARQSQDPETATAYGEFY